MLARKATNKKSEFEYTQMTSSCCCRVGSGLNVILSLILFSIWCSISWLIYQQHHWHTFFAIINYCIFKICVYLQKLQIQSTYFSIDWIARTDLIIKNQKQYKEQHLQNFCWAIENIVLYSWYHKFWYFSTPTPKDIDSNFKKIYFIYYLYFLFLWVNNFSGWDKFILIDLSKVKRLSVNYPTMYQLFDSLNGKTPYGFKLRSR